jgi:hypothetical protein
MKKITNIDRPWHLWIITIVALLLFSIGAYDFINIASQNMNYLSNQYSAEGVLYFTNYPLLLLFLFGINVFSGFIGIFIALFNKVWAKRLIIISCGSNFLLIFITVLLMDRIKNIGLGMTIQDILVMLATCGLYFYYRWLNKRN